MMKRDGTHPNSGLGQVGVPALFEGEVGHYRLSPTEHQFRKPIRLVHVDVDDLDCLDQLPFWSGTRRALMQVRPSDHLDGSNGPIGPRIREQVQTRLGRTPTGPITMLTQPRTWGYVFNPISIFYCWDESGTELDALVLEVTNTPWKERHSYVVDARQTNRSDVDKELHVSPFMPMNQTYRFNWRTPGESIQFSITIYQEGLRVFSADLTLARRDLTPQVARRSAFQKPWSTLGVSLGIHVEAAKLWFKGVPFQKHPARADEMTSEREDPSSRYSSASKHRSKTRG